MDVRCEKCQTEYELDEARLKPGGVTVKCTNCGHMFKIRKRSTTNVGVPLPDQRSRPVSSKPPISGGILRNDDDPTVQNIAAADERQWLIRLENGDQKSCRELATLQQWIVAGVVTRDSLISRTGKTWKSLGDIVELAQYFTIADEARATRETKPTKPPVTGKPAPQGTMLGVGNGPKATSSGGTIVDDEELEGRTTGSFKVPRRGITQPPPPPKSLKTPPMGSATATQPMSKPVVADGPTAPARPVTNRPPTTPSPVVTSEPADPFGVTAPPMATPPVTKRPITQPPPPPQPKAATEPAKSSTWAAMPAAAAPAGRSTAVWATEGVKPATSGASDAGPSGPFGGKIAAIPDEPAFAAGKLSGKVRSDPADESSFNTGKVRMLDEDDDGGVLPTRRGSRAGLWLALVALVVVGGGAAAVYMLVIKKPATQEATAPSDAAVVASETPDGGAGSGAGSGIVATPIDAVSATPPTSPLDAARAELGADVESHLREAMKSLDGNADADAQALRALLSARLAQDLQDRAGLLVDKPAAEKLRKEAKTIVIEAATFAQKAHKAKPEAPANLAMAHVLRLQGKRAPDITAYIDKARTDAAWTREAELAAALVLVRDGKLDDAKAKFAALDQAGARPEDVRAQFHLALIAYNQNRPADAKPIVDQILAAQLEHAGARALASRLETLVAKSDPLPPEDPKDTTPKDPKDTKDPKAGSAVDPGAGSGSAKKPDGPVAVGGSYDALMKEANKVADTNCSRAIELYQKARELKPDSAEALTGMGYCYIDAKQFASAQSMFRQALTYAKKYEPALYGVAEAYQQQGRKEDAINAFKAYLEVFPGAAKAIRQLERLGVPPDGGGTPTPPTPAPPTPTPTPTAPAGDGSATPE